MSAEAQLHRRIDFLQHVLAEIRELADLIRYSIIISVEEATQLYAHFYSDYFSRHGCYAIGQLTGIETMMPGAQPISPDEFETRLKEKLGVPT